MTELTILTDDNYYSDKTYMSVSRFKEYMKCEARAKAIDDGTWDDERDQKPLLFGNYVHSYFERNLNRITKRLCSLVANLTDCYLISN